MEQGELFPHVNDSIRRVASQGRESDTWDFICECTDLACHALVSLTLIEFDERRAAVPPRPVLAADHDG